MAEQEQNATDSALEGSALRIQSVFRAFQGIKRWQARANEILETETHYVENLTILLKLHVFYTDNLQKIFGNISVIYDIHADMLEDLKERLDNWGYEQTLGDVLNKYWKRMKIYSEYVNKYDSGVQAFKAETKRNKDFAKFMKQAKTDERLEKRDMFDLLIQPVQRIPRYSLLITELLKYTPQNSRDHAFLHTARNSVKLILRFFNESKRMLQRREDSRTKVKSIKRSVSGSEPFLATDQTFIMEGPLTLFRKKKVDQVYCFLFQETLLVAQSINAARKKVSLKKRMQGYKFSTLKFVKLKKYKIAKHESKNAISLNHQAHKSWSLEIQADNRIELDKWFEALATTMTIEKTMSLLTTSVDQL